MAKRTRKNTNKTQCWKVEQNEQCSVTSESVKKQMLEGRCFYCRDVGHVVARCPRKIRRTTSYSSNESESDDGYEPAAEKWTYAMFDWHSNERCTVPRCHGFISHLALRYDPDVE